MSMADELNPSPAYAWQSYYDQTRTRPRRRPAKVSTSGAGRGRAAGRQNASGPYANLSSRRPGDWLSTHSGGFGHPTTGGAAKALWDATALANAQLGDAPVDPFNGANLWDVLNAPGSDGNGGGDGGGGGGGSAADAAASKVAYQGMLDVLNKKLAADLGTFDTRQGSLNKMNTDALARLAGIEGGLNSASQGAAADIRTATSRADANMAALANQIAQSQAAREAGAGRTLGAFGVAPSALDRTPGAAELLAAARMTGQQIGGAWDTSMAANRQAYGALTGDAKLSYGNQFDALVAQLAAQRQQAQLQNQQDLAQLKLQAAQSGVKL